MQIDFHHAVTYVACRLAGMHRDDAATVAHAAQYVDDATNDGPLAFETGQRYVRVTSAHKSLDLLDNANHADNRLVWVPFHFLPGNADGLQGTTDKFIQRMVCKPDSAVARTMMQDCIEKQQLPFSLHRFGIALHTYVDTWAHQEFVGMVCDFNRIERVTVAPDPAYAGDPIYKDLTSGAMKLQAYVAGHLPVGHAAAVTYPDMPFLKWSFVRKNGEHVERDNPADFLCAATAMYNMVRRYLAQDVNLPAKELPEDDRMLIDYMLRTTLAIEGERRHKVWLDTIHAGKFSFGPEDVGYIELGPGSWKYTALGKDPDEEHKNDLFTYMDGFIDSDWKRFHDAVQYHRLFVLHELLPRFGLCAS